MANLSEDIQCAGSDIRPPMLDRTDFASWQQRIRLYCWGKENGVNIMKSIDEGPFQMGTVKEILAEGTEGAPHLGPKRPRVYSDLSPEEKDSQGNNPRGKGATGYGGAQNRVGNANPGQARQIKCYNYNGIGHIARNCTQPKHLQNFDYFKDKMLLMQAQENRVTLDEKQLLFLAAGQDNAIDKDAPTSQTMFMENPSSVDLVYDEADLSYDSDILSEYVKDNAVPGVQSNVSSVPTDAYMMIYNDMYEPHAQAVSKTSRNTVVDNSLTAKLATYMEQVKLYERQARPKPYYNELNKVAIGYKNPLCLTHAKQVHPALYNGHEIIKNNHVPAIVHNTEDTLEIVEITRRKMNDKMKDPECVNHKCWSFDFNRSLSFNVYKGLATLDKSKTTKRNFVYGLRVYAESKLKAIRSILMKQ
nr:integrase, catalytic region, zinc finger, CCHC-type, peptidase aspartic, catalytic [Tanacetum cinerariifolium]